MLAFFLFSCWIFESLWSSRLIFSSVFCILLNIISLALKFIFLILMFRDSVAFWSCNSVKGEPSGDMDLKIDLNSAMVLSTFAQEFLFFSSPSSNLIPASFNSKLLFRIADIPGAVSTRIVLHQKQF